MCIIGANFIRGQVTIGSDIPPEKAALLEFKNTPPTVAGGESVNSDGGGLLFPRVKLVKKDELLPFFKVSDLGTANYENVQKPSHTGLFVYNLFNDLDDPDGEGFEEAPYYWDGEKWLKIEKGKEPSIVIIEDCSRDIKVYGRYGDGNPLDNSNFVQIKVTVERPGAYSITATATDPDDDNGYFFLVSGEFLSKGTYTIVVPGMGTPINHGTDNFTIAINGKRLNGNGDPACQFDVVVEDTSVRPRYSMDCSKTKVMGEYYEEKRLDANHYIEVRLNVEPTSFGATYEIFTNEVDGIKFSGSGTLTSNPQIVRLYGEGVPFDNRDKKMYITTNSESTTATCVAEVFIIIPPKRILCIGYTATRYGYNWAQIGWDNPVNGYGKITKSNWMITDELNFGPHRNSIVRYSGVKNKLSYADPNQFGNEINPINNTDNFYLRRQEYYSGAGQNSRFRTDVMGNGTVFGMDIVIIGWTEEAGWNMTQDQANTLREFCEQGGILLVFNESSSLNQTLLRTFFNKSDITITYNATTNPAGALYEFANMPGDPIMNGPFGNISGLLWGEDASYTRWASKLPYEELVLYSNAKNLHHSGSIAREGDATAFRHRTLPFVWVGDGGFTSGSIDPTALASNIICPFMIGTKVIGGTTYNNYPVPKSNYGHGADKRNVYNAVFAANALAWCIQTAEELKRK